MGLRLRLLWAFVIPLILYSTGSWLFLLVMLIAEEPFDPIVSTFSKAGRIAFCDKGRMPSSYGGGKTTSERLNGLRIGIVAVYFGVEKELKGLPY